MLVFTNVYACSMWVRVCAHVCVCVSVCVKETECGD